MTLNYGQPALWRRHLVAVSHIMPWAIILVRDGSNYSSARKTRINRSSALALLFREFTEGI